MNGEFDDVAGHGHFPDRRAERHGDELADLAQAMSAAMPADDDSGRELDVGLDLVLDGLEAAAAAAR